jgi:hypothetical protein
MYAPMDSNEGDRTQCTFCEKAFAERHHFINHANKVKYIVKIASKIKYLKNMMYPSFKASGVESVAHALF